MFLLEKNPLRDNGTGVVVVVIPRELVKEHSNNKGLPVCVDESWSPSSDAFAILELANVTKNAALKHLKEFILYWKENGTALRSCTAYVVVCVNRKEFIGSYNETYVKKNYRHTNP